jgi:uncharacterized protein
MQLQFEYHEEKALSNQIRHGISFENAETVFLDEFSFVEYDEKHSQTEDRWLIVGKETSNGYVLVVSYTMRDTITRIISARRANEYEREQYEARRIRRLRGT